MTLDEAKVILKEYIDLNNNLYCHKDLPYINYTGDDTATLDGAFTADELEAIAVYMRERKLND